MKKVAVIIKHPFRDFDYRIDIVEVPYDTLLDDIRNKIMSEMLGPFEIIAMTSNINLDRKIFF